jgi:hypothetical protein
MVGEINEIHKCMRKPNERFAMRMHPDDMVDLVGELKLISRQYEDEHPPITKIYLMGVRIFADIEAPRVIS